MTTEGAGTNQLTSAASPYLRQHADNPVYWQEWNDAALAQARRENKPIFLSIGYAACHWCHVMAHESFADAGVAAVMNEYFVNIKVDREERPDLDEIYMQATLVLNQGQGGWPMSVWLTPDLKPFYAGTYFPPASRAGCPGFADLCRAIGKAWQQHREDIVGQADKLTDVVREALSGWYGRPAREDDRQAAPSTRTTLTLADVDQAAEVLAGAFDPVSGGLISGATNKFPPSLALDLMLRSAMHRQEGSARRRQLLELTELTLDHMATGGIHDQLGGGFHRYSTDVEWHVPHFEKMLYDQALLSRSYVDAYQLLRKPLYARIARGTLDYVLADLQAPEGGFCSSRDADSEGVEGKYYTWTRAEALRVVGPEDGDLFCAHYDISESGNWKDPHDPDTPKSVLRELRNYECCAKLYGITAEECERRLTRARLRLLAERDKRVPPALDDKVLCEWNGLMIASLARGGCVLGEARYVRAAARAAEALLRAQYRDGRLRRSGCRGQVSHTAFLGDYAGLIEGLLELYEATFEARWLTQAAELNRAALELYWDGDQGGFFHTSRDHEPLLARSKDVRDGAVPAANSVQLLNMLRLAALRGDEHLRSLAERMLEGLFGQVQNSPWTAARFLAAVDFACAGPVEIALVGDPAEPASQDLLRTVYATYLPNRVVMLHNPVRPAEGVASPLLDQRGAVDGRPTAYVCRNYTCRQPVTTPAELARQLAERP
jgi:uncharacterized protein YyaL (SSP411 family)